MIKCPMCGFQFQQNKKVCRNCPMGIGCGQICCPNCGYNLPGESKIISKINNIWERIKKCSKKN
ncbi:MAG: hypothetical protein HYU63_05990 [Armatimonadetes bacterium]|nr:hypothetical protein [Armatimonadota bacterium]